MKAKGLGKSFLRMGMIASVACALLVFNVGAAGLAKGQSGIPPFLDDQRLGLYYGGDKWLESDEPFYICHGVAAVWKELSPKDKQLMLDNAQSYNLLFVDDQPVRMKVWHHMVEGTMYKMWYVQFEEGAFESGSTHIFHLVWYDQGTIVRDTLATVHFT